MSLWRRRRWSRQNRVERRGMKRKAEDLWNQAEEEEGIVGEKGQMGLGDKVGVHLLGQMRKNLRSQE